jgi:hypothetical protein
MNIGMKGTKTMNKYTVSAILIALTFVGCGRGPAGPAGPKGDTGEQGPQGAIGVPGTDGQDATPVTVVKLCPGTTVYPSKFVEIAFCIGGKLYGTYSQNGGFSTELPPGTYGSNGINASCNFVILPNCQIQN